MLTTTNNLRERGTLSENNASTAQMARNLFKRLEKPHKTHLNRVATAISRQQSSSNGANQSIPQTMRQAVFLHEIAATRAPAWLLPEFHGVFRLHRTSRLELLPDQPTFAGCVVQHGWRHFRPEKAGKLRRARTVFLAAQLGEDIQQFTAVETMHRLHLAMQPAVRPAGDLGGILALRALKLVGPAHVNDP